MPFTLAALGWLAITSLGVAAIVLLRRREAHDPRRWPPRQGG